MPLEIIEVYESGDPLDEERKEHCHLVLEEVLKDPEAFIEEHHVSVISAEEGAATKVQLPLKKEHRFVYGDPSEESKGDGVLSSDRQQLGAGGKGDSSSEAGPDSPESQGGNESQEQKSQEQSGSKESDESGKNQEGEPKREPLKRGEDISELLKKMMEVLKELFGGGRKKESSEKKLSDKQASVAVGTQGAGVGDEKGETFFETEVKIDDLSQRLSEKYRLPDLDKTDIGFLSAKITTRPAGFRKKGPTSQIIGRLSAEERLKRLYAESQEVTDDIFENASWHPQDLRYRRKKEDRQFITNAVVNFVRDASGSINKEKLRLIRAFASHILRGIRKGHRDGRVLVNFLTFDTGAMEWDEDQFFYKSSSGGTRISVGIEKVLEMSKGEFGPKNYNHYTFFFTDGENEQDDAKKVGPLFARLCSFSKFVAYFEVFRSLYGPNAASNEFYGFEREFDNMAICVINYEAQTESAFEHFLERGRELEQKRGRCDDAA